MLACQQSVIIWKASLLTTTVDDVCVQRWQMVSDSREYTCNEVKKKKYMLRHYNCVRLDCFTTLTPPYIQFHQHLLRLYFSRKHESLFFKSYNKSNVTLDSFSTLMFLYFTFVCTVSELPSYFCEVDPMEIKNACVIIFLQYHSKVCNHLPQKLNFVQSEG